MGEGDGDPVELVDGPGLVEALTDALGVRIAGGGAVKAESPKRVLRSNCASGVPAKAPNIASFQIGPGSEDPNT